MMPVSQSSDHARNLRREERDGLLVMVMCSSYLLLGLRVMQVMPLEPGMHWMNCCLLSVLFTTIALPAGYTILSYSYCVKVNRLFLKSLRYPWMHL